MKSSRYLLTALTAVSLSSSLAAWACDLHVVTTSLDQRAPEAHSLHLDVSEEFSESRRIQENGAFVENTAHEGISSSRTSLTAAYDLSDVWTIEGSVPYINRRYRRLLDSEGVTGTEAGFGDTTIRVLHLPFQDLEPGRRKRLYVSAGVKLPTGDTDPLAESHMDGGMRHGGVEHGDGLESGVHGHDIALGSGSFDFPLGVGFSLQRDAFSLDGQIEYTIRTEGDHSYRHADDLRWAVGPGVSFGVAENTTALVKVNLTGAYKSKDTVNGEKDDATSTLAWYVGPELSLSQGKNLAAYLGYDLPVSIENSGYQAVTDYRLRAGLTYRF